MTTQVVNRQIEVHVLINYLEILTMPEQLIISNTAVQRGSGSDRYKSVSFLTADERAAAIAGTPVFFRSAWLSGGSHGTKWRRVHVNRGYVMPRVPDSEQLAALVAQTGLA